MFKQPFIAPSVATLARNAEGSTVETVEILRRFNLDRLTQLRSEHAHEIAELTQKQPQEVVAIFDTIARGDPNQFTLNNWRGVASIEFGADITFDTDDAAVRKGREAEEDLHQHIWSNQIHITIEADEVDEVMQQVRKFLDGKDVGDPWFLQIRGDFKTRILECAIRQQLPARGDRLEQDQYHARKAGLIERAEEKLHLSLWPDEPYGYSPAARFIVNLFDGFGSNRRKEG